MWEGVSMSRLKRWTCSECGDVIAGRFTHPPRVCETCDSRLPFIEGVKIVMRVVQ